MLNVTRKDISECGGFLSAITQVSSEYLHTLLSPYNSWRPEDPPDRLIVHKDPHLDDYMAEMFFRASMDSVARRREFFEEALYAKNDSTAQVLWPSAAVFGIGSGLPCERYAQYLFDEHLSTGGRTNDSCAGLVVEKCFQDPPSSITQILREVGYIDSRGGAHELHLNNLLKTCHSVQYLLGINPSGKTAGRMMSGQLADHWKRAVVNALVVAVIYCIENKIDITDPAKNKGLMSSLFASFIASCPYKNLDDYEKALQTLRSSVSNTKDILLRARFRVDGQEYPQLLVAPFMAVAARAVWGEEITKFLMLHFWESEVLKNIHFHTLSAMLDRCFADRNPKLIYGRNSSMGAVVLSQRRFIGKLPAHGGVERTAPRPTDLWILSCRHNNFTLQPNKAMQSYVREKNCGIGLVFCENTKNSTKVLFKARHLPDTYWNEIVSRIMDREPELWYRPQPTAQFIINGNPAHQYRDLSSLSLRGLARICMEVKA